MAWTDKLRPASFRGVPFFIEVSQFTTGRRVQLHEFPDRDQPFPEDLGKVSHTFRVEGHILGDDYWTIKDQLIEACEKDGPGELIHPYYGTKQVQVGPVSIDEDTKEGRIAKISFLFYEAGDNKFPNNVDDKSAVLSEKSDATKAAGKKDFDEKFSVVQQPGHVVDAARDKIEAAADTFESATEGVATTADEIADLAFSIRNLKADVNDLMQSPSNLSQRFLDSFSLLGEAVSTPRGKLSAFSSFFDFGNADSAIPSGTPSRGQQQINADTLDNFLKQASLAHASEAAGEIEFESFTEATEIRDQLIEPIAEQMSGTDDDDVFQALEDLNAQIVETLPNDESDLPSVDTFKVENTTAALLLAYDLFENFETEQDIIDRNGIRHPGFILGGTELEVINV